MTLLHSNNLLIQNSTFLAAIGIEILIAGFFLFKIGRGITKYGSWTNALIPCCQKTHKNTTDNNNNNEQQFVPFLNSLTGNFRAQITLIFILAAMGTLALEFVAYPNPLSGRDRSAILRLLYVFLFLEAFNRYSCNSLLISAKFPPNPPLSRAEMIGRWIVWGLFIVLTIGAAIWELFDRWNLITGQSWVRITLPIVVTLAIVLLDGMLFNEAQKVKTYDALVDRLLLALRIAATLTHGSLLAVDANLPADARQTAPELVDMSVNNSELYFGISVICLVVYIGAGYALLWRSTTMEVLKDANEHIHPPMESIPLAGYKSVKTTSASDEETIEDYVSQQQPTTTKKRRSTASPATIIPSEQIYSTLAIVSRPYFRVF